MRGKNKKNLNPTVEVFKRIVKRRNKLAKFKEDVADWVREGRTEIKHLRRNE